MPSKNQPIERIISQGDTVLFGVGAESALADELVARNAERVLLVAQDRHPEGAERLRDALGERYAGLFLTTVPQVPGEVADAATAQARRLDADWVVAHGGGTPVGVAKAIALELGVSVAAVPTTYAGSERTNIWGLTRDGHKTTGRSDAVRPKLVAYDPALFTGLPVKLSFQSLLNALAHSLEALYATSVTDEARTAAQQSLRPLLDGIRGIHRDPSDLEARASALRGAFLAATALGGASMALHHKLAHVLGGSFALPHAPTHATLLPWTFGYNLPDAPEAARAVEEAWGTDDPAAFLYDLLGELGLDRSLAALGFPADGPARAAELAMKARYDNPRAYTQADLETLLTDATLSRRPSRHSRRRAPMSAPAPHDAHGAAHLGPALAEARKVVLAVHGRGSNADRFAHDLATHLEDESVAILAPQAHGNSWYPKGFRSPVADNQPGLNSALAVLDALYAEMRTEVPAHNIVVVGFSQGACLALTWLSVTAHPVHTLLAFTGAATPLPQAEWSAASSAAVTVSRSQDDPWVPADAFYEAIDALTQAGADVTVTTVPGATHAIHSPDIAALLDALEAS